MHTWCYAESLLMLSSHLCKVQLPDGLIQPYPNRDRKIQRSDMSLNHRYLDHSPLCIHCSCMCLQMQLSCMAGNMHMVAITSPYIKPSAATRVTNTPLWAVL